MLKRCALALFLTGCAADVVIPPDDSDPTLIVRHMTVDEACLTTKLVARTMTIDERFSGEERGIIELAAAKWNVGFAHRVKHYLSKEEATADPNSKYYRNRYDSRIVIVENGDANDVALKAIGVDNNTLAITQKWTVYVWPERVHHLQWDPEMYPKVLYALVLHELGHVVYLHHVADTTAVMYGVNDSNNVEFKPADFDEFCSKWSCDSASLWKEAHDNPGECSVEGWQ